MYKFGKLFTIFWKGLLVITVYFVAFTGMNIVIANWNNIITSDQLRNYISGGKYLVIGDARLKILLADTQEKRIQGLSGKEKLNEDQAMLFVFDKNGKHGIWMKDMNFSIDVIWLDDKFIVVDFVEGITPESFPRSYIPRKDAKYVLETNTGFIQQNGIKIDDQATFLD